MAFLTLVSKGLFALAAYICLPLILVLIGIDVTLRYVFNVPLIWAQEASTMALFMAIILAIPESWRRNVHIRADFLTALMGSRLNDALCRIVWLMFGTICVLITVQCYRDIELMTLFNERSTDLDLPLSWFRATLGFVSAFCAILSAWKTFTPSNNRTTQGENR